MSTWENTKYLSKQEKKNFFLSFYNPVLIKGFLEKGIAGQWLSCFHMAVTITVSLGFFPGKIITIFPSSSMIRFYHHFKWLHNIPFRWAKSCLCKQALGVCTYMLGHISDCPPRAEKDNGFGGLWVLPKMLSQEWLQWWGKDIGAIFLAQVSCMSGRPRHPAEWCGVKWGQGEPSEEQVSPSIRLTQHPTPSAKLS